jgi:hypothetical protein
VTAALLAIALGAAAVLQWRAERGLRADVAGDWETSGAAALRPTAADRARRDPDAVAARSALARLLFAGSLHPASLAGLPPREAEDEARRIERRLALAQQLAAATLAVRPTSWEAALVLGGSRLQAALRAGGDELYARPESWREPLRHARRLAPGAAEPGRLLVSGTLASWHALSEAERAEGRRLLAHELRDPVSLRQLLPAWAVVAASRRELASVLPPAARTFELLQQVEGAERDWTGVCAAREHWRRHLLAELETRLSGAERRLSLGDRAGARLELLQVLAAAPLERQFAPLAVRALESLPAGPVTPQQGKALTAWLRWALPLWTLRQEPLPPATIDRLAGLTSELDEAEVALAALAAGHLDKAELWERRADRMWSEEWAAYATAKAEELLGRGQRDEAAAVLAEVHRSYRDRWAYRRALARLEAGRDDRAPAPLGGRRSWPAVAWRYERGDAFLEAVAAEPAPALAVAVDVAPRDGSAVELTWDGATLGCVPAATGAVLRVPVAVTAAAHLLGVRDLGGERIAPGGVWLDGVATDPPR